MDMHKPLSGKTVAITRSRDQAGDLARLFMDQGASIIEFPTIQVIPPKSWADLDKALENISNFHWIIFSSTNAVKFFMQRVRELGKGLSTFEGIKICAVGPKTAEALESFGLKVGLVPAEFKAEGVLTALGNKEVKGRRFLIPRAKEAREIIPEGLKKLGAEVTVATVYENVKPTADAARIINLFELKKIDIITFTSSSTVRNFVEILGQKGYKTLIQGAAIACIGPTTGETAQEYGMPVDIMPKEHTIPALIDAIAEYFNNKN